jgi:FkbM family methyltransferase
MFKFIFNKANDWLYFEIFEGWETNFVKKLELDSCKFFLEQKHSITFSSQYLQDFFVFLYFQEKRGGFYIDIGANDGITLSNTFVFEQLGWKGICIEPLPEIFVKLQANRRCDLFNVALSNRNDDHFEFAQVFGPDMLSTSKELLVKRRDAINAYGGKIKFITVKAMTFDALMKNYPKDIDFLSLDIEGGELNLLKSIDFNKYHFKCITVENNEPNKVIINFMNKKGYKVLMQCGVDLIFVSE